MVAVGDISPSHLQQLADNGHVVVENFISKELQDDLRKDVFELRSLQKFKIARIGHDGMVQDENTPFRDVRWSETCFIGKNGAEEEHPHCKARTELHSILEGLKTELDTNALVTNGHVTKNVPTLDSDMEELMYAYYPKGGYYRRHKDADPDTVSTVRKYSFLLYLNQDWASQDGGALRIHFDSGGDTLPVDELPNYIDVPPKAGTLVCFRSDMVPHEVLDTQKERIAIVGWFLSQDPTTASTTTVVPKASTTIHADALASLQALRDASPRLAAKLKPAPPVDHSGMLGGFCMPGAPPPAEPVEEYPDSDPRYWKKICTFSPESGTVTTLSLGGNRLKHLREWESGLLKDVVTLDLASTDLEMDAIVGIVSKCPVLRHLHLGGNGTTGSDVQKLLDSVRTIVLQLATLDLRYNNIGQEGMAALSNMLQQEDGCCWSTLYLEGNQLTDNCFVDTNVSFGSTLVELYLGQNQIGPEGAGALAQGLLDKNCRLKKLYLESNQIQNAGAKAFYEVLEGQTDESKTLEKLYVENNGIGKEESIRLGRSLNSPTFIGDGGLFQD